ncbi:kinesin motor domain-containing protein [Usnea florida]
MSACPWIELSPPASQKLPHMEVNMTRSNLSPPTSALPQLPASRLRTPSSLVEFSQQQVSPSTALKFPPNPPSMFVRPLVSPSTSHPSSSPKTPTLRSNSTGQTHSPGEDSSTDKEIRRSVSIANFPQPPKVRRIGLDSKYSTATHSLVSDPTAPSKDRGDARSSSLRIKRLKSKASTDGLGQMYSGGRPVATLLNGSGDDKAISSNTETGVSNDLATTTFEDTDDKRVREEGHVNRKDGGKRWDPGRRVHETKGNVIVSVRVRPDASAEKLSGKDWMVDSRQSLVAFKGGEGGNFYYDNVFAAYDQNHKVYDASAKRLVRRVMEGYHGTVFAYGMTGTGKTFSMQGTATSPGVIPLAITDIFSFIRETPHREFLLRISYLEIYNEKIHDLLNPPMEAGIGPGSPQPEEIKLREDPKRGVFASPLKEEIVQSPTQLLRVIARGDQSRRTRSTQYNAQSSRSHAVVQIVVESRERAPYGGRESNDKRAPLMPGGVRVSTLSMIDLAGSERAAENKERRTEGSHINKSLLTLGTVIARLSGDKDSSGNPTDKDGKHLPYRDSKLTRLLQPALSGNSLVSILCTVQLGSSGSVTTSNVHTGETLNTLKFAARAKNNIVSHAKKAEEALGSGTDAGSRVLLERYRMEIQNLRNELDSHKKAQEGKEETPFDFEEKQLEREAEQRREEQMLEMQLARTALNDRIEHLNRLILSSKSSGVNASGQLSSMSAHQSLSINHRNEVTTKTLRSLRPSGSQSSLGGASRSLQRTVSAGSTITAAGKGNDEQNSPVSSPGNEEDWTGEFGDGTATSKAHISALQTDLADKNRYISTLEKRLLQARRSSHSKSSTLSSPTSQKKFGMIEENSSTTELLKEKDAEIADLRARLDDKDRMITALRSAARNRDTADFSSELLSPGTRNESNHQSNESKDSGGSVNSSGNRISFASPVSPVQLLSPTSPAQYKEKEKEKEMRRKSIDEMTKILDGMINDRVQTGGLVIGANGVVRPLQERRKESLSEVPSVGALAASLRPVSAISEAESGL